MKLVINGEERSFGDDLTLAALVEQLGVKPDRVAVELNHDIVRRDRWTGTVLHDGDRLEVVHFVGGGRPAKRCCWQSLLCSFEGVILREPKASGGSEETAGTTVVGCAHR